MPFATYGKNLMLAALPSTVYAQLHTGDPGANGTLNVLSGGRVAVPLGAASSGVRPMTGGASTFSVGAGQTVTHVSYWDASSNGNLLATSALPSAEYFAAPGQYLINTQDFTV